MTPLRDIGERASLQTVWQSDTPCSKRLGCLAKAVDLLKRNAGVFFFDRKIYNVIEGWKVYVYFSQALTFFKFYF